MPEFRFHEYFYPILCPGEAIPLMVGTRIGPFVGKARVRNNKPDQARDGAIVSLGIHASW
ncbi:unnamed protein product [marine sediment metagenome]|uniref:Uncharacterized protein n=1 Tax=marine sediment metagenome TaxID=412755 RepID=X1S2M4_9ZZZZ